MPSLNDDYAPHQSRAAQRMRAMSSLVAYLSLRFSKDGSGAEIIHEVVSESELRFSRKVETSAGTQNMHASIKYQDDGWLATVFGKNVVTSGHGDLSFLYKQLRLSLGYDKPPAEEAKRASSPTSETGTPKVG